MITFIMQLRVSFPATFLVSRVPDCTEQGLLKSLSWACRRDLCGVVSYYNILLL